MKRIVIIGGGASGLMAAIAAASCRNVHVQILEHKNRLGKKILSTGNGKCNLTNEYQDKSCYRSETPELAARSLGTFGYDDTIRFFEKLWLHMKSRNGYIYPMNEQAAAVADILIMEAERLGVETETEVHANAVETTTEGRFRIRTNKGDFTADRVILATGGKAAEVLGSDGSGYAIARSLGHSIIPVVPALVQLKVKDHPLTKASGVRVNAKVSTVTDSNRSSAFACGNSVYSDTGEVQLTKHGISGIPVFQISRYVSQTLHRKQPAFVELDFLPSMNEAEVLSMLMKQSTYQKKMEEVGRYATSVRKIESRELLMGLFHTKLIPELLKLARIAPRTWASKLTREDLQRIQQTIKHLRLRIIDTGGFENAQVCAGGVRLSEVNSSTMESLCQKGVYLTGELLDVDGMCGGYNLQWAWTTGYLAGINAGKS